MAESKRTVNGSHKKKRKLNAKGRALVRRSIGGVLLASSLIVAAIPSDRSGKASAAIPDDMNLFTAVNMLNGVKEDGSFYGRDDADRLGNTGLVYADDLIDAPDAGWGGTTIDLSGYDPTSPDTHWSLTVNANGQLQELFGYYTTKPAGYPSQVGIIGAINPGISSTISDLMISNVVCECYDYYTETEYSAYMSKYTDYAYTVENPTVGKAFITADDDTKTGEPALTNNNGEMPLAKLGQLFPEANNLLEEYNTLYKWFKDEYGYEPSYDEMVASGWDRYHIYYGRNIKAEDAYVFFCSEHKGRLSKEPLIDHYTLEKVSTGLIDELVNPDDPTGPKYNNVDVKNIYIVKDTSENKNFNFMDTNGYLYAVTRNIIGVGDGAFKGNDSISSITLEGDVKYLGKDAFNNCIRLRNVTLKGISFIDSRVFYGCTNLSNVSMEGDIQTIGNEAFYNCALLSSIAIPDQVNNIGFGAFAKCSRLSNVTLGSNKDCTLGDYAFFDDPFLATVDFSQMNLGVSLGKACFALSDKSNSDAMVSFTFPSVLNRDREFTAYGVNLDLFKDGTEARGAGSGAVVPNTVTLDSAGVSALKSPCEYKSVVGDFIFANRSRLSSVTFDAVGTKKEHLPMNTFLGCDQLKEVHLADDEDLLEFDANLFRDVKQAELCVYGPPSSTTNTGESEDGFGYYAQPRMSTWATYSGVSAYVPYRYRRGDTDHFEVGGNTSGKAFIFDLALNSDGQTASLQNCTFLGNLGTTELGTEEEPFMIPASVADYRVSALMPGSLNRVKDNILYLEVPDNSLNTLDDNTFENSRILKGVKLGDSVNTIGDACFKGCPRLEKVTIGPSIMDIGDGAFASCPVLLDVYWDQPANLVGFNIGQNAFKTTSDKLYFHGNADSNIYAPFAYAMQPENTINGNTHICYMTTLPYDMTDPANTPNMTDAERKSRLQTMSIMQYDGDALLINYPRFQNLPASIRSALSNGQYGSLYQPEQYLVGTTINVSVPNVVDTIDVNAFINDTRVGNDKKYLEDDEQAMYGGMSVASNYTSRALIASLADDSDHPGLFSGRTVDNGGEMVNAINSMRWLTGDDTYTVASTRGNDWVQTIKLPRVKELPDYCFDSCERLMSINLGENLGQTSDSIGQFIFHGCDNLQDLSADHTRANDNLTCANMILYRNVNGVPSEVIACLNARGSKAANISNKTDAVISDAIDPLINGISSIRADAFEGCKYVKTIDLTNASSLQKIDNGSFMGCESLAGIKLPETLQDVGDDAFKGCDKNLLVRIPGNTSINVNAFDSYSPDIYIRIQTPDKINGFLTPAYKCTVESGIGPEHIHWEPMYMVRIEFFDSDRITKLIPDLYKSIENGAIDLADSELPDSSQIPYFTEWGWMMDDGNGNTQLITGHYATHGIKEDRQIFAITNAPTPPDPVYYTVTFYDDIGGPIPGAKEQVEAGYTNFMPKDWKMGLTTQVSGRNASDWEFDCWICYADGVKQADDAIYHATINSDWTCHASFKQKSSASSNTPTTAPTGATGTATPTPRTPTPTNSTNPTSAPTGTPTGATPTSGGSSSQNYTGKMYYAIVENGSGSGQYPPGSVITLTAYAAPEGRTFDRWTTSNTDIGLSNALASSTTFIMPSHDVKVTATYRSASASGNTVTPIAPTGVNPTKTPVGPTATPTPVGYNNGTEVRITTDTIDNNKKNLGSASVAGSTDNFIVKVTDSAAATAAVEAALRTAYGERFTDLRYAAFDISLYDSTGTYLVANANNLAVTITLPIPEALLSYAGNNKAGAVINGQLQELAVNYTTIDGVPCMRFTANHFSPYTIYVDTKNIVRGITDNTPKTGDGIAPKWFLSGGMLSMSAVLFLWKEKNPLIAQDKKRRKRSSGR